MNRRITILLVGILAIALIIGSNTHQAYALTTPQITLKIRVTSLDGYAVPKAYADLIYKVGNKTVGPINFPATGTSGQANITFPLNQTLSAKLNVTFLNTVVLENYNVSLEPNRTLTFNLTVNVVNLTYQILSPLGGQLTSSSITFTGKANVSAVSVSRNTPNGSVLLPTGTYTVTAYRGPEFYNQNLTINLQHTSLTITAPLLSLNYIVKGVNGQEVQAQEVDLLYSGALVDSSTSSSGVFTGLLPGYYQVVVSGQGLSNTTFVPMGSNTSIIMVLPIGYHVSIRLTDEFGTPLANYNVTLEGSSTYTNTTNSGGITSFLLPQGEYIIKVYSHGQLVFATTSYIDSSGTQQLVLSVANASGYGVYIIVRIAFGLALIVLAALILLLARTKTK
jgi:hypothetical protein